MGKFRKFLAWWLTIGAAYFVIKSGLTAQDKVITIPLFFLYAIFAAWFGSLGMEVFLNNKLEEMRQNLKKI